MKSNRRNEKDILFLNLSSTLPVIQPRDLLLLFLNILLGLFFRKKVEDLVVISPNMSDELEFVLDDPRPVSVLLETEGTLLIGNKNVIVNTARWAKRGGQAP